ncbi:MAG: 50S ribosomal protein L5 [Candidatus Binatia bacterium]
MAVSSRLAVLYRDEIRKQLQGRFGFSSISRVPKLDRVVVNMGLGAAVANPKLIDEAVNELGAITGQKPVVTRARKSIANFKLREGMPVGVSVTLRSERMYEFFDRLVNVVLPRVRDFRGLSRRAFDGRGNYTVGLKEHLVFPEIDLDKVDNVKGMGVSLVTTARTDEEGEALLTALGLPLKQ